MKLYYYEVTCKGKTFKFMTQQEISKAFSISQATVSLILHNKYKFPITEDIKIERKLNEIDIEKAGS